MTTRNTIFALASARGRAGVAVFRVSGPKAFAAGRALAGKLPAPRSSRVAVLRDPESGEALDQAVVINFESGASFTSEDVVEFHTHGSPAVVSALLDVLSRQDGLRLAEPGEFTRRALENGNLDLAQVEGLADLLEAETEAQRKQALRIMRGAVAQKAENWRKNLIRAQALIAVTIDFSDEDIPQEIQPELLALIRGIRIQISEELRKGRLGGKIRSGFEVALVGRPNVGKSTLLNAIAGREVALTSETAGTTRDIIELKLDLAGIPVTLLDTAGMHAAGDELDRLGVERAISRAGSADLRVFLVEGKDEVGSLPVGLVDGDLLVASKSDLNSRAKGLPVSGKTEQGVDALLTRIGEELSGRVDGDATMIRERQWQGMASAIEDLVQAENRICSGAEETDLVAEDLRLCARSLDSLLGRVDVENILDQVFGSFCLGK